MSASFPSGTVTFFFCDLEGSTPLWEKHPEAMQTALARHDQIIRQAIEANQGNVIKTTGDGFHAAFPTALDGVLAAFSAQQALCEEDWAEIQPDRLRSRMGLHTGEAVARAGDYYGTTLNRAARLMAIGHGGQVLLSSTTTALVRDRLPKGASLLDLGEHLLRDLIRPEHVYQLVHPSIPSTFPPLNALETFPNNLPVQLTSFIGREQEIAEVNGLLNGARMVTLIGPGGTGKTRLALQAAAELLLPGENPPFPHGVWLVEFAAQMDPNRVVETVAEVFHLQEMPGSPPLIEIVSNYLRSKRLLLIMDNCEHLIEACARLADILLRACPGVKILASSREAFGISGEIIHRVPSLTIPQSEPAFESPLSPAPIPRTGEAGQRMDSYLQYEAVQLFVERARAAQPRFSLTERSAPAIVRICQRLDGIPLALELAAARVQVFTPEQIAARLDDRFRLLTGGSRTALHRQQTLRALIDWSYDLLPPPEQALFRLLSVFTGGWSYDAAEYVCGDSDVIDRLTNLVNKSLIIVNEQGSEARYSFLETIRQYARDKLLEAGESEQARDRHLDYYLQLTRDADEKLNGVEVVEWMDRVDLDIENIRSAVEWGLEQRSLDSLAILGNLHLYFSLRGGPREAQRLIRAALSRVESLSLDIPGLRVKARGLTVLGLVTITLGEIDASREITDEAIRLARTVDDQMTLCFALADIAAALNYLNEARAAKQAAEESLMLARRSGSIESLNMSQVMLIWAEGKLGNHARREELLRELRERINRTDQGESPLTLDVQLLMGIEARLYGDLDSARAQFEWCLAHLSTVRSRSFESMARSELAHLSRQMGDYAAAKQAYWQTLSLFSDLGHRAAIAHQLECLAYIAGVEGQYPRAARLFGAAEALREAIAGPMTGDEVDEYQQEVIHLREALPEPIFSQEWSAGRGLNMEEAISFSMEEDAV